MPKLRQRPAPKNSPRRKSRLKDRLSQSCRRLPVAHQRRRKRGSSPTMREGISETAINNERVTDRIQEARVATLAFFLSYLLAFYEDGSASSVNTFST